MRRLEVRPGFVFLACSLFYLCSASVFWPFVVLSFLHELGHFAALAAFGVEVRCIRLGASGAVMETCAMPHLPELVCALAGPGVNLFCFWVFRRGAPSVAMLSLVLGCYNLLPLMPFDGGRALRAALSLGLPLATVDILMNVVAALCLLALGGAAAYASRWFGRAPLLFFALLLARVAWEQKYLLPS